MMGHHAYLLVGSFPWARAFLKEKNLFEGPDTVFITSVIFGIDDARAIIFDSLRAPIQESKRTFVLLCTTLTLQAQNALLKLFEDPCDTAQFYLVVPHDSILIPTLRSRLAHAGEEHPIPDARAREEAHHFMHASYRERLTLAGTYSTRDDETFVSFLRALETLLFEANNYPDLHEILFLSTRSKGPGASKKMLLEHVALSLSRLH